MGRLERMRCDVCESRPSQIWRGVHREVDVVLVVRGGIVELALSQLANDPRGILIALTLEDLDGSIALELISPASMQVMYTQCIPESVNCPNRLV